MERKINQKAKKIILICFSFFLVSMVGAVDLGSIPPLPDHFIGNVTVDGQSASIGTLIKVYVNSELEFVYNITQAGKYNLYVKTGISGNSIEFKISDKIAGTSNRSNGGIVYLNLAITTTSTETTTTTSSGGSSGGGGGGGGGSTAPSVNLLLTNSTESNSTELSDSPTENSEIQEETQQNPSFFRMTGVVTGFAKTKKGIATIFALIIILGIGVMLIKFKPQKWKKNF
ncbi:MAG: hypothetical protein ABIJ14_03540 [Nanoarchaeota archaeon]